MSNCGEPLTLAKGNKKLEIFDSKKAAAAAVTERKFSLKQKILFLLQRRCDPAGPRSTNLGSLIKTKR